MSLDSVLLGHGPLLQGWAIYGTFTLVVLWEVAVPRRRVTTPAGSRWIANIGLTVAGWLAVRWAVPLAGVGVALAVARSGWGLLNLPLLSAGLGPGPLLVLGVLALDLGAYATHRVAHAVPALWRLHRVHHSDLDVDVTTGLRFHPLDWVVTAGARVALVAALGVPPVAVLLHELMDSVAALVTHADARLPGWLDRALRVVLVTPDMHRVHHSAIQPETDRNFGTVLAIWDRAFGTYRAQPAAGHDGMTLGLLELRDPAGLYLHRLLTLPFRTLGPGGAGDRPEPARMSRAV